MSYGGSYSGAASGNRMGSIGARTTPIFQASAVGVASSPASGEKKTRKHKACMACKAGHLKCDHGTPSCARCLSKRIPCVYSEPPPSNPPARPFVFVDHAFHEKPSTANNSSPHPDEYTPSDPASFYSPPTGFHPGPSPSSGDYIYAHALSGTSPLSATGFHTLSMNAPDMTPPTMGVDGVPHEYYAHGPHSYLYPTEMMESGQGSMYHMAHTRNMSLPTAHGRGQYLPPGSGYDMQAQGWPSYPSHMMYNTDVPMAHQPPMESKQHHMQSKRIAGASGAHLSPTHLSLSALNGKLSSINSPPQSPKMRGRRRTSQSTQTAESSASSSITSSGLISASSGTMGYSTPSSPQTTATLDESLPSYSFESSYLGGSAGGSSQPSQLDSPHSLGGSFHHQQHEWEESSGHSPYGQYPLAVGMNPSMSTGFPPHQQQYHYPRTYRYGVSGNSTSTQSGPSGPSGRTGTPRDTPLGDPEYYRHQQQFSLRNSVSPVYSRENPLQLSSPLSAAVSYVTSGPSSLPTNLPSSHHLTNSHYSPYQYLSTQQQQQQQQHQQQIHSPNNTRHSPHHQKQFSSHGSNTNTNSNNSNNNSHNQGSEMNTDANGASSDMASDYGGDVVSTTSMDVSVSSALNEEHAAFLSNNGASPNALHHSHHAHSLLHGIKRSGSVPAGLPSTSSTSLTSSHNNNTTSSATTSGMFARASPGSPGGMGNNATGPSSMDTTTTNNGNTGSSNSANKASITTRASRQFIRGKTTSASSLTSKMSSPSSTATATASVSPTTTTATATTLSATNSPNSNSSVVFSPNSSLSDSEMGDLIQVLDAFVTVFEPRAPINLEMNWTPQETKIYWCLMTKDTDIRDEMGGALNELRRCITGQPQDASGNSMPGPSMESYLSALRQLVKIYEHGVMILCGASSLNWRPLEQHMVTQCEKALSLVSSLMDANVLNFELVDLVDRECERLIDAFSLHAAYFRDRHNVQQATVPLALAYGLVSANGILSNLSNGASSGARPIVSMDCIDRLYIWTLFIFATPQERHQWLTVFSQAGLTPGQTAMAQMVTQQSALFSQFVGGPRPDQDALVNMWNQLLEFEALVLSFEKTHRSRPFRYLRHAAVSLLRVEILTRTNSEAHQYVKHLQDIAGMSPGLKLSLINTIKTMSEQILPDGETRGLCCASHVLSLLESPNNNNHHTMAHTNHSSASSTPSATTPNSNAGNSTSAT